MLYLIFMFMRLHCIGTAFYPSSEYSFGKTGNYYFAIFLYINQVV